MIISESNKTGTRRGNAPIASLALGSGSAAGDQRPKPGLRSCSAVKAGLIALTKAHASRLMRYDPPFRGIAQAFLHCCRDQKATPLACAGFVD
jgi:hypothetical protein